MRKVKSGQAGTWEWLNIEINYITVTDALLAVLGVLHFTLLILILIVLLLLRQVDSILR